MHIARFAAPLAVLAAFSIAASAQTETPAPRRPAATTLVWAAKPNASPFVAPNKPAVGNCPEILAAHAGQKKLERAHTGARSAWRGLTATYIQMAPGEKTKSMLYADTSIFLGGGGRTNPLHHPGAGAVCRVQEFHRQRVAAHPIQHGNGGGCHRPCASKSATARSTPLYPISETPTPVQRKNLYAHRDPWARRWLTAGRQTLCLDYQKGIADGSGRPPRRLCP